MRRILWIAVLVLCAVPVAAQQSLGYSEKVTGLFVTTYQRAAGWSTKALVLNSLGEHWHPVAEPIFVDALAGRDPRLYAFAVEALLRSKPEVARAAASPALMELLIQRTARPRNELLQQRVVELLARIAPDSEDPDSEDPDGDDPGAANRDAKQWRDWWKSAAEGWQPGEWPEIPAPEAGEAANRTVTVPVLDRVMDLGEVGLDLVICIDSTSSMQKGIDHARDAVREITHLLAGIAPSFRVGLVHYKDVDDIEGGAEILAKLGKDPGRVHKRLERLREGGGGDVPEAVERGLELALSKRLGWDLDANKMILLIGDAPPHQRDLDTVVDLARRAHRDPGSLHGLTGSIPSSKRSQIAIRPFVISAIAYRPAAVESFEAIATAGGGVCAQPFEIVDGNRIRATGDARVVVEHVLATSFGARLSTQVGEFVRLYFLYRDAGLYG